MTISENQKRIYNQHLISYKQKQNKPFTLRQNFDDLLMTDPNTYVQLQKLESFFNNNKQVNMKLFFIAPYQIYEDQDFYSLNYYTSQAAVKAYTTYLTQLEEQSPDSPSQLSFIKDSLKFIQDYCCQQKIDVIKYLTYKEFLPLSWAVHIAEHKISFYVILGFNLFNMPVYESMYDMPEDERVMLLGDIIKNYAIYKEKLEHSKNAKKLIFEGIKIIDKNIKDNLTIQTKNDSITDSSIKITKEN